LTNYQVAHLHDIEGLNIFEHCLFSRFTRESDMGQNRYLYDEMYEIFIISNRKNISSYQLIMLILPDMADIFKRIFDEISNLILAEGQVES